MIGRFEVVSLSVLSVTGLLGGFLLSGPLVESIPWFGGFRDRMRDSDGVVTQSVNDVRLRAGNEITWSDVLGRTAVDYGDQIFVGEASTAEVDLRKFSLSISENSLIRLEKRDDSAVIELEGGGVKLRLKDSLPSNALRLSLGGADLQIDGPDSEIAVQKNEKTKAFGLSFLRGRGAVRAAGGEVVEAQEGRVLLVAAKEDEPGLSLRSLLLEALAPEAGTFAVAEREVSFSWRTEGEGMRDLSLEVAKDENFREIEKRWALKSTASKESVSLRALPPGTYHWRLRAKGPQDVWLYSGARKLDLVEVRGIQILDPRFRFVKAGSWEVKVVLEEIPRTKSYEIESSRGPDFRENVQRSTGPGFVRNLLFHEEGRFYLRARQLFPGLHEAPWSETVTLDIPAPLPTPEILRITRLSRDRVEVSWDPLPGIDFYRIFESEDPRRIGSARGDVTGDRLHITAEPLKPRFLRIASHRRDGVYGFPGKPLEVPALIEEARITEAKLHPPSLSRMGKGSSPWLEIEWEGESLGKPVILEASRTADFKSPVRMEASSARVRMEVQVFETHFVRIIQKLPPQSYLTNYSAAVSVDPMPIPDLRVPAAEAPLPNERLFLPGDFRTPIRLSWAADPNALGYDVQISRDADFKRIILRESVREAQVQTGADLPSGDFYWRVRSYSEFKETPWGPVQMFRLIYGK